MSKPTCGVTACGKPAGDAFVCKSCGRDLERDLAETPWLVDELETVLTRQTVYGTRSTTRSSRSTPLVFDVRASNRLRDLERALRPAAAATRIVAATIDGDHHRAWNVNQLARAVLLKLDELRRHIDGPDHVDTVKRAYARARAAIDRPADKWYAGPCWVCSSDLFAHVSAPVVTCQCGAAYDVKTRRDYLLTEAEDQLTNAAIIARSVSWLGAEPLTAARVRKWAERGRIIPRAWDRCETHRHDAIPPRDCKACSPLYRVGDAIDLLAADTNRKETAS